MESIGGPENRGANGRRQLPNLFPRLSAAGAELSCSLSTAIAGRPDDDKDPHGAMTTPMSWECPGLRLTTRHPRAERELATRPRYSCRAMQTQSGRVKTTSFNRSPTSPPLVRCPPPSTSSLRLTMTSARKVRRYLTPSMTLCTRRETSTPAQREFANCTSAKGMGWRIGSSKRVQGRFWWEELLGMAVGDYCWWVVRERTLEPRPLGYPPHHSTANAYRAERKCPKAGRRTPLTTRGLAFVGGSAQGTKNLGETGVPHILVPVRGEGGSGTRGSLSGGNAGCRACTMALANTRPHQSTVVYLLTINDTMALRRYTLKGRVKDTHVTQRACQSPTQAIFPPFPRPSFLLTSPPPFAEIQWWEALWLQAEQPGASQAGVSTISTPESQALILAEVVQIQPNGQTKERPSNCAQQKESETEPHRIRPAPEDGEDTDKSKEEYDSEEEYDGDATLNNWLKDERKTKPLGPYHTYHEAAKWIVKAFYPFTRYNLLWTVYRWTQKRAFFNYETERKIPEDDLIVDFSEDLGTLQRSSFPKLAQAMGTSASRGRGDDISGLKSKGINYAVKVHQSWYAANPWATRMDPVGRKEVVRGSRDPLALYLLLPPPVTEGARNNWENGWKEFSNQVIGGKIKITGIELPRVLYHNLNYDPDDLQQRLLLNELLIMVWNRLFLAPASAVERDPKPAPSTGAASRHGMTSVTPNSITYAALLLFWTPSDLTNWKRPEHFAAEAYWEVIVSMFIGDVHGDGEDINEACFGDVDDEANYEEPIVPSTWELVRKQRRAAKEARAKETQAGPTQTQSRHDLRKPGRTARQSSSLERSKWVGRIPLPVTLLGHALTIDDVIDPVKLRQTLDAVKTVKASRLTFTPLRSSASSRSSSPGPTSTGASSSTRTDGDDDAEQLANHC
ncbi:hypothetical protein FA13DRAFT_1712417 [Coprinellus micaceus]|uniref:Fungal-type protein kinase domain-containing protein n=1 Tax=Coprinellus micaceus TaxID=71717 RepID=A0A4Y7T0M6_COPMI|nr:hypothetical protein FA13DRAFT_1712417 [Coprinellus micaceus]